VILLVTILPLL
jgi:hypothetical protein